MLRIVAGLALLALPGAASTPAAAIDPARLSEHVRVLSSDAFEGRGPGTPAEDRTLAYLVEQFRAAGLQPGGADGGWFQTVQLQRFAIEGPVTMSVRIADRIRPIAYPAEGAVGPERAAGRSVAEAPMVFVGYGVHAPERGWDDYKGADLRGRIAIVLDGDPDDRAEVAGLFGGPEHSQDGEWSAKYAELDRRGAVGMLMIHDPKVTGFAWPELAGFWPGPQIDIVRPKAELARAPMTGWLRGDVAAGLFAGAGLDLEALRGRALAADFRPVTLPGARFSAAFEVRHEPLSSRNILALLPGRERPDETFLYFAHWDHLGRGPAQVDGDDIYNGALDNASGLAGLLELARVFAAGPRPRRSILFIGFTHEETGLLGSRYYAAYPVRPLGRTVGGLNIDGLPKIAASPIRMSIGGSGMDDILRRAAARQQREVIDPRPWKAGAWAHSDHYPLAVGGLPVLFAGGRVAEADYFRRQYHQPDDEWSTDWDWASAAREVELYRMIGQELADGRAWPEWTAASEFRPVRERTRSLRPSASP